MRYRLLGGSGLRVSEISSAVVTWGDQVHSRAETAQRVAERVSHDVPA